MSRPSQVPRRVSATVVLRPKLVHVRPAIVPVPIATSRMSKKFQVRTRLLAAAAERPISAVAHLASVLAIPAQRQIWRLSPAQKRQNAPVVEMRRIVLARQESALAAVAPSRLFERSIEQSRLS